MCITIRFHVILSGKSGSERHSQKLGPTGAKLEQRPPVGVLDEGRGLRRMLPRVEGAE